jgi:hypothetical protein
MSDYISKQKRDKRTQKTPMKPKQVSPPIKITKLSEVCEDFNSDLLHNSKFGLLWIADRLMNKNGNEVQLDMRNI